MTWDCIVEAVKLFFPTQLVEGIKCYGDSERDYVNEVNEPRCFVEKMFMFM
jgi:hypothetical protein